MRGAVLLLFVAGHCAAQSSAGFAGTWVQKWQGLNFRVLTIQVNGAVYSGSAAQPRRFPR